MQNFLVLNSFLLVYLLFTAIFSAYKAPKTKIFKSSSKKGIPPSRLILATITGTILVFAAFSFAPQIFLHWYLRIAFSILAIVGAFWMGLKSKNWQYISLLLVFLLLIWRFTIPNFINHNFLIALACFWIGNFFVSLGVLSKKKFIFLSIAWALYDLYFVWISSAYSAVDAKSSGVGFPLGFVYKTSLIGSGDLIWASLFLAVARKNLRLIFAVVLLLANFLLGYLLLFVLPLGALPLLLFWVPVGLGLLYLETRLFYKHRSS